MSALRGRSVLVTGADGLLGSWLTAALLGGGARVVAIRRDEPAVTALDLAGIAGASTRSAATSATKASSPERWPNTRSTASFISPPRRSSGWRAASPRSTFETNVRGTWILLEAWRAHGVGAVVVASSDKAYGPADAAALPRENTHWRRGFPTTPPRRRPT